MDEISKFQDEITEIEETYRKEVTKAEENFKTKMTPLEEKAKSLGIVLTKEFEACDKCGATGRYYYSDTATWRKGAISGKAFTWGTCDKCWGTGNLIYKGVNLRVLETILTKEQLERLYEESKDAGN